MVYSVQLHSHSLIGKSTRLIIESTWVRIPVGVPPYRRSKMFILKLILFFWICWGIYIGGMLVYRLKINRNEKWIAKQRWKNSIVCFSFVVGVYPILVVPYWVSRIHVAIAVTIHNVLRVMLGDMDWWDLRQSLKQLWWDTKWLP